MSYKNDLIGEIVAKDFRTAAIFKKYKHDLAVKQGKKKYLVGLWSERVFLILMMS